MRIPKTAGLRASTGRDVGDELAERRGHARLYAELASRHLAEGADTTLVATLVRAAWRAHAEADRLCTDAGPGEAARTANANVAAVVQVHVRAASKRTRVN